MCLAVPWAAGLFVGVEIDDHQVFAGDVLLLCCDGLHGSVTPSEMAELVGDGAGLAFGRPQPRGARQ